MAEMKSFRVQERIFPVRDLSSKRQQLRAMQVEIEQDDKLFDQAISDFLGDDHQSGLLLKAFGQEADSLIKMNTHIQKELEIEIDRAIQGLADELNVIHEPMFTLTYEFEDSLSLLTGQLKK